MITVNKSLTIQIIDWLNQGLPIQMYFYDYIIYTLINKLLHQSKPLILYLLLILEA